MIGNETGCLFSQGIADNSLVDHRFPPLQFPHTENLFGEHRQSSWPKSAASERRPSGSLSKRFSLAQDYPYEHRPRGHDPSPRPRAAFLTVTHGITKTGASSMCEGRARPFDAGARHSVRPPDATARVAGCRSAAGTCTSIPPAMDHRTSGSVGPHVLVHPEKVRRVVLPLERDEARVVLAVRGADALGALVGVEEVDVDSLGELRLHGREQAARPRDVPVVVHGVRPVADDDDVV